jgi:Flp pilus assembly protein TadG
MVEFAIASLVLLILVFGVIDFGRAYFTWQSVKNSAREGAAFAERNPLSQRPSGGKCADPNNIQYRARTEQGSANTSYKVTVTATDPTGVARPPVPNGCEQPSANQTIQPGDTVTVHVDEPFQLYTPLIASIVGNPVNVSADQSVVFQG